MRVDRIEPSNELVYVGYNLVNEDENYYSVNAQIPILNIDTEQAKKINAEIKKVRSWFRAYLTEYPRS